MTTIVARLESFAASLAGVMGNVAGVMKKVCCSIDGRIVFEASKLVAWGGDIVCE